MKAINWKKLLPHFIAIIIFLVVAAIFCRPSLEGKVLYQHDIVQYEGASKDISDYKDKHGEAPLWTNNMFSGMPTYQIWMPGNNVLPHFVNKVLTLGLPQPMQFFFLACVLFYFLSQVAGANPWVGVFGALAFAYSTYNPVIIAAGHVTKMWCIAYMPAMIASLMLIYRKKYLLGTGLLALFTATQIGLNHLQISYYLFFILAFYTIACIVKWVKNGEYAHMGKSIALALVAGIIGVMVNSITLLTTYEYSKETIRGGSMSIKDSTSGEATGLTKDYAFSYSYKPVEAFSIMFPRVNGGSNGIREFKEDSRISQALSVMPAELAQQLGGLQNAYWGGLDFTSGPVYFGALICFLFIVFLFVVKGEIKWWILGTSIFAILLSWGKFFPEFNNFLFDYLPLYNKFRAPSMSLVMLEVLWPLAAVLALQFIIDRRQEPATWQFLRKAGIATAIVFFIAFVLYLTQGYTDEGLKQLRQQVADQQPQIKEPVMNAVNGLIADRKGAFLRDIFKALAITGGFFLVLFLFVKNRMKSMNWVVGIGILLLLIDLLPIGSLYMTRRGNGEDAFTDASEAKQELVMGKADQQILLDKGWYRVLNLSVSPFQDASTSYFHKSIGGYHAAKIGRYQDLIENKLAEEISQLSSDSLLAYGLTQQRYPALNMLNTKYIIGSNPPVYNNQQPMVIPNPNALGPAWFVKEVRFAGTLPEQMDALHGLDASTTAIVPKDEQSKITQPEYDSAATITLVANENNVVKYQSNSTANQFAVFSEVYYSEGWNAYIDGKPSPYVKTNYTLRGMNIPAGTHSIEFRFEPKSYHQGRTLTMFGQVLVILLLLTAAAMEWWKGRRKTTLYKG